MVIYPHFARYLTFFKYFLTGKKIQKLTGKRTGHINIHEAGAIEFTGHNQENSDRLFNLMNEINRVFNHQDSGNKSKAPVPVSSNKSPKSTAQSSTMPITQQKNIFVIMLKLIDYLHWENLL